MQRIITYSILFTLIFGACQSESNTSATATKEGESGASQQEEAIKTTQSSKDCPVKGQFLPSNKKYLSDTKQTLYILADESTKDAKLGDSHRVLSVVNMIDCKEVFREILPVNRSPDFGYQLADINYNNTNALIAMKSFDKIFCYDIKGQKLLPELSPKFYKPIDAQDAQSGMIKHLELWEDYMIGYALDFGTFVFDLRNKSNAAPIAPYSDYANAATGGYHSLFALDSADGNTQFLFPRYDRAKQQFILNPIFNKPIDLDASKSIMTKDKRYAILRRKNNNVAAVIDLKMQETVKMPPSLVQSAQSEIIKWLSKR